jgi:carboxymethylenebutenolidase
MQTFSVDGNVHQGYLALPSSGFGNAILVLHAWWGLNDFFKTLCDRLAANGFVAFAPDLNQGKIATTVKEAEDLMERRDFSLTQTTADAALHYLQTHPSVRGNQLGELGFSMGANYALLLDEQHPGSFAGIVLFYGGGGVDLSGSKAKFLAHFATTDEYESIEDVRKMNSPNAEIFTYPDTSHWFFEDDRPEHNPEAANLAWERTLEFFNKTLLT